MSWDDSAYCKFNDKTIRHSHFTGLFGSWAAVYEDEYSGIHVVHDYFPAGIGRSLRFDSVQHAKDYIENVHKTVVMEWLESNERDE